jgi:hypothetical protein
MPVSEGTGVKHRRGSTGVVTARFDTLGRFCAAMANQALVFYIDMLNVKIT